MDERAAVWQPAESRRHIGNMGTRGMPAIEREDLPGRPRGGREEDGTAGLRGAPSCPAKLPASARATAANIPCTGQLPEYCAPRDE
jgi:hypothetical protein